MHSHNTPFSVPAVWSVFYHELKGSPWEEEDIDHVVYRKNHDAMGAALALRYVYQMEWKGVEAEDGVLATLKAAQILHGGTFLTPAQVRQMARNFVIYYRDAQEPVQEYLAEHCGEVRWNWLNEHGQQEIVKAVRRESDIWVESASLTGVFVFTKCGYDT